MFVVFSIEIAKVLAPILSSTDKDLPTVTIIERGKTGYENHLETLVNAIKSSRNGVRLFLRV